MTARGELSPGLLAGPTELRAPRLEAGSPSDRAGPVPGERVRRPRAARSARTSRRCRPRVPSGARASGRRAPVHPEERSDGRRGQVRGAAHRFHEAIVQRHRQRAKELGRSWLERRTRALLLDQPARPHRCSPQRPNYIGRATDLFFKTRSVADRCNPPSARVPPGASPNQSPEGPESPSRNPDASAQGLCVGQGRRKRERQGSRRPVELPPSERDRSSASPGGNRGRWRASPVIRPGRSARRS